MNLLSRIQGSLMGVMLGDALGMPWEIFDAAKIMELTNGVGVTGFSSPIFRKLAETEHLTVGSTTDDWQLTAAILNSLVRRKGFDIFDIALAHVEAYEQSTSGWGGTTRKGLEELREYFNTRGQHGRSPLDVATGVNGKGLGNGIGMKISPIPLLLARRLKLGKGLVATPTGAVALNSIELRDWVVAVGKLTHPDFRATVAGYALASIILDILMFDLFNNGKNQADTITTSLESQWLLNRTIYLCKSLEETQVTKETDLMSSRLEKLLDENLLFGPISNLISEVGTDCMALESICFAIAIFLRHPRNFRDGLLEAVNSGGDTDTIAAMTGSLIGAVVGIEGIPTDWIATNSNFSEAIALGQALYKIN